MNTRAVRGFLGLAGYYMKFIQHFDQIAAPLRDLLKKDGFCCNPAAELAFKTLKTALANAPVLALPDISTTFIIECDASGPSIGAVLIQPQHPVTFFNKSLHGISLQ